MKRLAAVLMGVVLYCTNIYSISAQTNITNDYIIITIAEVPDPAPYTTGLDVANWESFRLQNSRRSLSFENGFTIELKSALELLNAGYPLNLNNYAVTLPEGYIPPVLELLAGNIIGVKVQTIPHKSVH